MRSKRFKQTSAFCFGCLLAVISIGIVPDVFGATRTELENQIKDTLAELDKIQREIDALERTYTTTTKQKATLQNALNQLEITKKKLIAELSYTEKQITASTLTIEELTSDLNATEAKIAQNSDALGRSLVELNDLQSDSTIEELLKYRSLSEAWDHVNSISRFQSQIKNQISTSKELRDELIVKKTALEAEKKSLLSYKNQLADRKSVAEYNSQEQAKLLAETRNKEAAYKKLLDDKIAQREEFEEELFKFESEFRIAIDPNSIPTERSGVLAWPLKSIFVTQLFGKTVDSKKLYTSGSHNGVDFRAPNGTTVLAALSGTVEGTGNTDLERGCYSYGKWVLIRHGNGLSSLYAHLSQISVKKGDSVVTGDIVGYSGNTGYSTGPHLHFGLYASQGVRIAQYTSSKFCKNTILPLADVKAYLDPMAYFPKL